MRRHLKLLPLFLIQASCLGAGLGCSAEDPVECRQSLAVASLPPYCSYCNEDGHCDPEESCRGCPQDCGECADGPTWRPVRSPTNRTLYAVRGSYVGNVWAVGQGGVILHLGEDGWELMESPTTEDLYDLWTNESGDLWVVGAGGTVMHRDLAGWTKVHQLADLVDTIGEPPTYTSISGVESDIWVVPDISLRASDYSAVDVALHYDGAKWVYTTRPICESCLTLRVSAFTTDYVWILRSGTAPQRWTGKTWVDVTMPIPNNRAFFGLWPDFHSVWFVGEETDSARGVVMQLHGSKWTEHEGAIPVGYRCRAVWGHADEVWLACLGGAILHWDKEAWSVERKAGRRPGLLAVWGSSPDDIWAVGVGGTILHRFPD